MAVAGYGEQHRVAQQPLNALDPGVAVVRVLAVVIVIVPSWAPIGIGMVLIMRTGGRDGIGQLTDSGG